MKDQTEYSQSLESTKFRPISAVIKRPASSRGFKSTPTGLTSITHK